MFFTNWKNWTIIHLLIAMILLYPSCKFKNTKLRFFGILPVQNTDKKILISNSSGLFTNEFGKEASFTVRLSLPPDSEVKIGPISVSDPNEGTLLTNTTLQFSAENYDTEQTVTIKGLDDGLADGNKTYSVRFGTVQTSDYSYSLLSVPEVFVLNTDKATASLAASPTTGLSTNESGTATSFNVVLSTQPGADVVIPGFVSDTPTECSVSGTLTFTRENWDVPQTVTVTGVDDLSIDGPKTCLISSQASTSDDAVYAGKTIPVVTVVNVDNDSAGFTFIPITSAVTTEAGGQAQFAMIMNTIPNGNVSITGITTSDATEGTISPANVTFTPATWNVQQVLTLSGVDDYMQDGDINYTVVFPNATAINPLDADYNGLPPGSAGSFTNTDNDTRGVTILPLAPTTSISPLTVTEAAASQTFRVKLNSVPCDNPGTPASCSPAGLTINFTNNDTSQYTISPSSLTFTSGDWNTYQTITVTAVDDDVDDGDFDLTLVTDAIVSTTDYNGYNPSDVSIRVINNDTAGFTINPTGGVTVNENDPGGVGLETTITVVLNSQPTANVTLGPVISTDTLEVIVAPTLGGGNASITNRTLVFTPTKNQAIINSDSNMDGNNDTSTGGWNMPQTIRVRAVVDGTLDGTKVRAIQFGNRTTADVKYANTTLTPTPDVPATNIDSGTPEIILQNISALSFNEDGSSTITFQIVLATLPLNTVTISNIVSSDTTEGIVLPNGGGGSITNRTLVFTTTTNQAITGTNTTTGGWNMPQTVTIRSVADDFDDGNIQFKITIPTATGDTDYNGLRAQSANASYNNTTGELTLTNIDNDTRGFTIAASNITNSATPLTITEGGASGSFTIRLNSSPCSTPLAPENCTAAPVTINLTNNNTGQYTISPSSLTFTAGSWNTDQTVTVTPVNDDFDENDMDFTLVLNSITASSTDYDGQDPSDVYVRVQDNDTRNIVLSLVTGFSDVTSSGGGYTEYNLRLGARPAVGNTVTVTASVPTTLPQEGRILAADNLTELDTRNFTFDSTNWSTVQTFRVKGKAGSGSGSATYNLSLSSVETGVNLPPTAAVADYNKHNITATPQVITNYHIGTGKKIRLAGTNTTLTEATATPTYFWVLLNQEPTADVTINFGIDSTYPCTLPASVGSSTQFTVVTASLVLNASNWNQITDANRVEILRVDDLVDDGDVSCPLKITSVTSADAYYTGLTTADFNEPTITVTDNDTIGITKSNIVQDSTNHLVTSTSGAQGSISYNLNSQPMTNVVLTFSGAGGRGNYSAPTLTFTPANYTTPQVLTITGVDDGSVVDGTYILTATASSGEAATGFGNAGLYNGLTSTQNTRNVYNLYDLVPCTTVAVGSCTATNADGGTVAGTYITNETGSKRYFAIRLRARPTTTVSIGITSSNLAEGVVSPASLSFTTGNWNTLQVTTITGQDDVIMDGNINYTIDFGAMSGNPAFTTIIPSLNATNNDND